MTTIPGQIIEGSGAGQLRIYAVPVIVSICLGETLHYAGKLAAKGHVRISRVEGAVGKG